MAKTLHVAICFSLIVSFSKALCPNQNPYIDILFQKYFVPIKIHTDIFGCCLLSHDFLVISSKESKQIHQPFILII